MGFIHRVTAKRLQKAAKKNRYQEKDIQIPGDPPVMRLM